MTTIDDLTYISLYERYTIQISDIPKDLNILRNPFLSHKSAFYHF